MDDGFRLRLDADDALLAPTKAPNENVDVDSSKTGDVIFKIPATAKKATLRVGYYDGQRSEIAFARRP